MNLRLIFHKRSLTDLLSHTFVSIDFGVSLSKCKLLKSFSFLLPFPQVPNRSKSYNNQSPEMVQNSNIFTSSDRNMNARPDFERHVFPIPERSCFHKAGGAFVCVISPQDPFLYVNEKLLNFIVHMNVQNGVQKQFWYSLKIKESRRMSEQGEVSQIFLQITHNCLRLSCWRLYHGSASVKQLLLSGPLSLRGCGQVSGYKIHRDT